jgi:anti-sigma regulatory factor (Ser/Thr protein kinase)
MPTDADAPGEGRALVGHLLSQSGVGAARRDDLALVVTELITNAVVHGPSGTLRVRLSARPTRIRVEVSDDGRAPFEWPEEDSDGHWGLGLVRTFSDRVGIIRSPSTLVWAEFDL